MCRKYQLLSRFESHVIFFIKAALNQASFYTPYSNFQKMRIEHLKTSFKQDETKKIFLLFLKIVCSCRSAHLELDQNTHLVANENWDIYNLYPCLLPQPWTRWYSIWDTHPELQTHGMFQSIGIEYLFSCLILNLKARLLFPKQMFQAFRLWLDYCSSFVIKKGEILIKEESLCGWNWAVVKLNTRRRNPFTSHLKLRVLFLKAVRSLKTVHFDLCRWKLRTLRRY